MANNYTLLLLAYGFALLVWLQFTLVGDWPLKWRQRLTVRWIDSSQINCGSANSVWVIGTLAESVSHQLSVISINSALLQRPLAVNQQVFFFSRQNAPLAGRPDSGKPHGPTGDPLWLFRPTDLVLLRWRFWLGWRWWAWPTLVVRGIRI